VAGGHDRGSKYSKSCELYNKLTGRWTSIVSLLKPRAFAAAASHNKTVFVFGGRNSHTDHDDAEQYDAVGNTWTVLPARLSRARRELAAACVDGQIYLLGGCKGKEQQSDWLSVCERFDVSTGEITPIADLPRRNYALTAVCVGMSNETYDVLRAKYASS
jgi:N-acetylneuraminic acid mutarotase